MRSTDAIRIGPSHPVWDGLNDAEVRRRLTALIRAALRKGSGPAARQHAEWEEVLSEVCDRALRRADQYDPVRGPVLYWLGGIAWTVMRERRPSRPCTSADVSSTPDPAEPISEAVLSRLHAEELVGRLPPHIRQLLLWSAEGRTAAEMASDLGIAEGAVRARLHRARQLARTLLGPDPLGEGRHD